VDDVRTTPVKVNFHDSSEFFDELRKDQDRIDRKILRITVRRRYAPPFVNVSVVATALVGITIVVLEHRVGEVFAGDEKGSPIPAKIQACLDRMTTAAEKLGLEVRAGVFE
jgi:hypothetical protein